MLCIQIKNNKIVSFIAIGNDIEIPKGYTKVPEDFAGVVGNDVRMFDDNWKYFPLTKLVDLGYVKLSKREKIVNNEVTLKTFDELCADGVEAIPYGMKLDGGKVVMKSADELIAERGAPVLPTEDSLLHIS